MDKLLAVSANGMTQDWLVGGEHVERVSFTEAEWAVMMTDPRFGYVQSCGHPTSAQWSDGTCGECERLADAYEAQTEAQADFELRIANAQGFDAESVEPDELPF